MIHQIPFLDLNKLKRFVVYETLKKTKFIKHIYLTA